jgi:hypothetical protein
MNEKNIGWFLYKVTDYALANARLKRQIARGRILRVGAAGHKGKPFKQHDILLILKQRAV